jgi:hypothetical protein
MIPKILEGLHHGSGLGLRGLDAFFFSVIVFDRIFLEQGAGLSN